MESSTRVGRIKSLVWKFTNAYNRYLLISSPKLEKSELNKLLEERLQRYITMFSTVNVDELIHTIVNETDEFERLTQYWVIAGTAPVVSQRPGNRHLP